MVAIMPDHVACTCAQFGNSAMAEAADIAVDIGWFKFVGFFTSNIT